MEYPHTHLSLRVRLAEDGLSVSATGRCRYTGTEYTAWYDREGYERFRYGEPIQEALPHCDAADREWLVTAISPAGWAAMEQDFPDDIESEED